jgi:hypothetical protein
MKLNTKMFILTKTQGIHALIQTTAKIRMFCCAGYTVLVPPGRKIMLHFEKDSIVLFHKSLPLSSVFDVGYTTVVNYKARRQNDIIKSWMPADFSLPPIFTDLVADSINRYAGRMSHKFVWMPGTAGFMDPKFISWREDARTLTLSEERAIGSDIMAACAMMHEFIDQPQKETHLKMPGVSYKKLGRVTGYMQRLLGPSSEQIRRWRGHGRPGDRFLEEDSDVVEPPPVAPVEAEGSSRGRKGKRSKAGAPTSPPPRGTSRKGKEPRAGPSAASSPPRGRSGGRKTRATVEEPAAAPEPQGPSLQQQLQAAQQQAEELTNRAVSQPTQANRLAAIEAQNRVDELDEQIRSARESERKGKRKVSRSAAAAASRRPEGQSGARAPPEVPGAEWQGQLQGLQQLQQQQLEVLQRKGQLYQLLQMQEQEVQQQQQSHPLGLQQLSQEQPTDQPGRPEVGGLGFPFLWCPLSRKEVRKQEKQQVHSPHPHPFLPHPKLQAYQ